MSLDDQTKRNLLQNCHVVTISEQTDRTEWWQYTMHWRGQARQVEGRLRLVRCAEVWL